MISKREEEEERNAAAGFAQPEPDPVARIIETDGSVFVAHEWGYEDEGVLATGSFSGTQERDVTVLIPRRSVRRIVFEAPE